MKKVVLAASLVSSLIAIMAVIICGIKISNHSYDITIWGWIIAICLVILLICAIYNLVTSRKR